ncbi:MAG: phenylalanine--tRNA ligase subunit alpha [Candidatus Thorarchaeota archaeon]|nr:MAG: phenylalanine--tRNA ligase subunit alpha [Candidatus Thorarchaeota archaeon]
MTEQLTEGEAAVLAGLLRTERKVPATTLATDLGEGVERVVSILQSLAERGLVKLDVIETETYNLTEEGREYAEIGLPEFRLFDAVQKLGGKAELDEAITQAGLSPKTKGIAVNWAKKKGLLEITKEDSATVLNVKASAATSVLLELLVVLMNGEKSVPRELGVAMEEALERKHVTALTSKAVHVELAEGKIEEARSLLSTTADGALDLTSEMLISGSWKDVRFRPYNVSIEPAFVNYGKKHPYAEFNDWLREIMVGLGFTEWFGPYVETEFWAHDSLFVPQDHVSREIQDQFRVGAPYSHGEILDETHYKATKAVHEDGGDTGSKGWEWPFSREVATRLCLRPHTTPVSMRYLWEHRESPQKMFIIDRNFRSETLDATHAQEFNQCEGIIMDKGLTLRDLLGYLTAICKGVGINKLKFKPDQFPFTEPSVETIGKHEQLGWIELGGSGIFRPEVTYPLGIKDPVLAWGIGSGRLYMASMGIEDIRDLFSRDLNWLRRRYFIT